MVDKESALWPTEYIELSMFFTDVNSQLVSEKYIYKAASIWKFFFLCSSVVARLERCLQSFNNKNMNSVSSDLLVNVKVCVTESANYDQTIRQNCLTDFWSAT